VYLMDERFAQNNVRRLLPRWWQVEAASLSPLHARS
jgi:Rad3-related DNA helicase